MGHAKEQEKTEMSSLIEGFDPLLTVLSFALAIIGGNVWNQTALGFTDKLVLAAIIIGLIATALSFQYLMDYLKLKEMKRF